MLHNFDREFMLNKYDLFGSEVDGILRNIAISIKSGRSRKHQIILWILTQDTISNDVHKRHTSGGSKGGRRGRAPPPGVQILSISCSFWENLTKSYVGAPLGSWRPLLGEILDPPLHTVPRTNNKTSIARSSDSSSPY